MFGGGGLLNFGFVYGIIDVLVLFLFCCWCGMLMGVVSFEFKVIEVDFWIDLVFKEWLFWNFGFFFDLFLWWILFLFGKIWWFCVIGVLNVIICYGLVLKW